MDVAAGHLVPSSRPLRRRGRHPRAAARDSPLPPRPHRGRSPWAGRASDPRRPLRRRASRGHRRVRAVAARPARSAPAHEEPVRAEGRRGRARQRAAGRRRARHAGRAQLPEQGLLPQSVRRPAPRRLLPDHARVLAAGTDRDGARDRSRLPRPPAPADPGHRDDVGSRGRGGVPGATAGVDAVDAGVGDHAERLARSDPGRVRPRVGALPARLPRGRLRLFPPDEDGPRRPHLRPFHQELSRLDEPARRRHLPEPPLGATHAAGEARRVLHTAR